MNSSESRPAEFNIGRVITVSIPFILVALGILGYSYYGQNLNGSSSYSVDDLVPVTFKFTFRDKPLVGAVVQVTTGTGEPHSLATTNAEGEATPETDIGNGVLAMGVFKKSFRVIVSGRLPGAGVEGPEFTPKPYRSLESTPIFYDGASFKPGNVIEIELVDDGTGMSQEEIDAHMARIAEGQANAAAMSAARDRQAAGGNGGGQGGGPGGRRRGDGEREAQGPGENGAAPETDAPMTEEPSGNGSTNEELDAEAPMTETSAGNQTGAEAPGTDEPGTSEPSTIEAPPAPISPEPSPAVPNADPAGNGG